jgi:hypothetical protein
MLQRTTYSIGRLAHFLATEAQLTTNVYILAPVTVPGARRFFSSNGDSKKGDSKPPDNGDAPTENEGLIDRVARTFLGGKDSRKATGRGSSSATALVAQNPEQKHRKVLVVELARKPLFPGIYTPVLVGPPAAPLHSSPLAHGQVTPFVTP